MRAEEIKKDRRECEEMQRRERIAARGKEKEEDDEGEVRKIFIITRNSLSPYVTLADVILNIHITQFET